MQNRHELPYRKMLVLRKFRFHAKDFIPFLDMEFSLQPRLNKNRITNLDNADESVDKPSPANLLSSVPFPQISSADKKPIAVKVLLINVRGQCAM